MRVALEVACRQPQPRTYIDSVLRELRLEPGANLVDDAVAELAPVVALIERGALRVTATPTFDQDWSGGNLPSDTTSLTEAAALRCIAAFQPNRTRDGFGGWRFDFSWLENSHKADPRPAIRDAIKRAISNAEIAHAKKLLA